MIPSEHVFTVDVEDWYQGLDFDMDQWARFAPRLETGLARLLDLLAAAGARATFFVVGWQAERTPGIVREIARQGHEIACHGYSHRFVYRLTPATFREEVRRSRDLLESRPPADVVKDAVSGEAVGDGDRVDGFAFVAERDARLEDDAVGRAVEVVGGHDVGDGVDGVPGQHHRAEDGLLRVEVLRRERRELREPVERDDEHARLFEHGARAIRVARERVLGEHFVRNERQTELAECAERVRKAGVAVGTTTTAEAPVDAIVACANKIVADLIVMGTQGLTGLKHVLLGSVAERTLRLAPCPVLTLKAS